MSMLLILFACLVLFLAIFYVRSNATSQQSVTKKEEKFITGMIFTSGLPEGELGLKADYQIVKYAGSKGDWEPEVQGYFIENNELIETYLGECVRVSGVVKEGWEDMGGVKDFTMDGSYTYGRSVFVPSSIKILEVEDCMSDYSIEVDSDNNADKERAVSGKLQIGKRPAPDISYDYRVKPNEDFYLPGNASGMNLPLEYVEVIPTTDEMEIDFLNNVEMEFELEGVMAWGYSESQQFWVTDYQILQ